MISTKSFESSILKIIELHSFYFYIVNKDQNIRCTCITHETSQADPACKKCLGTGYKITIREARGASQDSKLPTTFKNSDFIVARNYFIPSNYKIDDDDLIIDNGRIYSVYEIQELIGLEGRIPYSKCSCVRKKFDTGIALKNFNEIVKRKKKV